MDGLVVDGLMEEQSGTSALSTRISGREIDSVRLYLRI